MPGLEDLYREIILDHYRNPRNQGELEAPPAHRIEGFNPLCGDEVVVTFTSDGTSITDVKIAGHGCSISQASASMMSAAVLGKSTTEIRKITQTFKAMMSIDEGEMAEESNEKTLLPRPDLSLGDLEALRGVVKFPVRIKCATLPWNALLSGLDEVSQ